MDTCLMCVHSASYQGNCQWMVYFRGKKKGHLSAQAYMDTKDKTIPRVHRRESHEAKIYPWHFIGNR